MRATKKIPILMVLIFGAITIYAQRDLITRHNGEVKKKKEIIVLLTVNSHKIHLYL